ncbi:MULTISPECIES: DUF898 family protein [unclassified Beijerinckia]|uniref:YjgN family protein n=1 Tax=unclassified Beijerinckia TaxID=2638183 RepID=UPI0008954EC0|nr:MULTISPECIES: DUF898 family protein [unclassified Beijerinckia]MDH7796512.1 uncharacterized membrane protein YjgN (DUF898 family) [Beijerinckia sp. GAS462]SEC48276.1 Uncharacterized membrane protein YjgN, DUF898 family [Beijerinckia sp. 28-YEA-48]
MTDQLTTARAQAPADRITFLRDGRRFLHLLVRGALLQLVTFGFYRFWLTTDLRRHLWSRTALNGENFEYTGRGRELLVGFLIALAILVPIYLVIFLIGLWLEQLRAFSSLLLILFMYLFGQFALYRARRYRLSRTVWRGVRFWMTGSGWAYALRAFGWQILVVLSLGLVYPWYARWRESFKMRNTYYGDAPGAFEGRGGQFFKRGIGLWLLTVGGLIALLAGTAAFDWIKLAGDEKDLPIAATFGYGAAVVLWFIASLIAYPYFRALEWRWWAQGVRLGNVSMNSTLRGGQFLRLYLRTIGWALLLLIGWLIVGALLALIVHLGLGDLKLLMSETAGRMKSPGIFHIAILVAAALFYLLILMSFGIVQRFFGMHEIWRAVVESLTVAGVASLEGVAQRGDAASALGEGLADSLDIGGF